MVKLIVAVAVGLLAPLVLWAGAQKVRAMVKEQYVITVEEECSYQLSVACVGYTKQEPIDRSCLEWLGQDTNIKALSECLHAARAREKALKLHQLQRAQAAAKSI